MKLIDLENIDFVILEDSLHRIEHKKGDEVDCVIGAQEVKAIPIERLEQIKTDIKKEVEMFPDGETYISTDIVLNIIAKALKEQKE